MNIAVIYATMTGHSKKLAECAADALGVKAVNIKTQPDLKDIDLLFIAGGVYASKSHGKLIKYAQGIKGGNVKNAAIITSCASGDSKQTNLREILKANGVNVTEEEYICKGSFLYFAAKGHPDPADIKGAADFAIKVSEKLKG